MATIFITGCCFPAKAPKAIEGHTRHPALEYLGVANAISRIEPTERS